MSFTTFFPADALSLVFVIALIGWFAFWLTRLRSEAARLDWVASLLKKLDDCVDQLRTHQLWRDRERIQGKPTAVDPGEFFDGACAGKLATVGPIPPAIQSHFRAIFVAGCDESSLDVSELNAQTCQEIANKSEQLRSELLLILLLGVLGTLLALSRRYSAAAAVPIESQRALPPLIWGALLAIAGGVLYLQYQGRKLMPVLAELRRKTTTLWIPRLYPTVAQRAAQWAIHTLRNAARVTDASEVIEKHAVQFVGAVESARQAAEMFSGGMREFSHGMDVSDRALQNAQTRMAAEVDKFADSLQRWGRFEDEIRRFYAAVEGYQRQMVNEHKTFEAMLSGYYDLVRQSTDTLQKSVSDVTSSADSIPEAFRAAAEQMTKTVADLGSAVKSAYRDESIQTQARIQEIIDPVLKMEDRLRALGTPFESASSHLTEIATNLWRLNDNFAREVSRSVAELQAKRDHVVTER
ncbi:MAG: Membrane protein [Bryobacterales bacterium]|nr:Membrane protein [Bryobacterales bacterium]